MIPMTTKSLVFIAKRALSIKKRRRMTGFSEFELCMRKISRFTRLQYRNVRMNRTRFIRNRTPTGPEKNNKLAEPADSSGITRYTMLGLISTLIRCGKWNLHVNQHRPCPKLGRNFSLKTSLLVNVTVTAVITVGRPHP